MRKNKINTTPPTITAAFNKLLTTIINIDYIIIVSCVILHIKQVLRNKIKILIKNIVSGYNDVENLYRVL